ncbi:MAG: agmatine deiminase family protein [Xanthomonadaceae bacterium]|nr:agmatine deiminase family protein [Xanthomonadaceae bacterium]MDE1884713.1 agmatine deiminase family protein [Xanthomonadaceae bacterium]MDE2084536.1 agmatine deiminase family protein [Xanthomonadaceae bacterium]MDE2256488.1 agmatine deiminase family protein [Xanthomonadaceae bacterium]
MTSAVFRLPAEWEPQAGVLLAWPHAQTDWAERLADAEAAFAALTCAIARHEPVLVCVADATVRARATQLLTAAGADASRYRFIEIEYDDTWLRDSGPITLRSADGFRLMDFRFTGWGGKFAASRDDRVIEGLAARELFRNADHRRVDWALEGGAIESDGTGTILTTWRCLHQRHPEQSREQMTRLLCDKLGAERVLWLERGYLQGDDTDAHIDTLARFAPDNAIVFQSCDDRSDPHFDELVAMRAELAGLRTAAGQPYRLHPLPWPRPIFDDGRRLAASYANYLVVNGAVLLPAYGDPADAEAARAIAAAHPGRAVIAVPCRSLIWQNGSLHCLTMQLPEGVLA